MIFELCCITLLALISLLLCVILERAKETKELNVRIATALSLLAPKIDKLVLGGISRLSALEDLNDKLDVLIADKAAEEKPGNPDLDEERSEADKAAEKAFSEGVLAILNYDATTTKEAKD